MRETTDDSLLFALDIGTRSVIGVVGDQKDDLFCVRCTEREEYKSRAVVDGQIEDIAQTAQAAGLVKARLEEKLGQPLHNVYIAAAGRALRTVDAAGELALTEGEPLTEQQIAALARNGVQKAYEQLMEGEQDEQQAFFCVGHAVRKYLLDGYEFSSLLGHQGRRAQAMLIVTFLPREVIESLYATMAAIGLTVSGLTLEPIAAMNAIIPADLRKLNLALCDIGAGTSDIALCENGSVSAYTMATVAGDEITEALMQSCLVDFATAEQIKCRLAASLDGDVAYQNILGLQTEEPARAVFERVQPAVENLAGTISGKILETNGRTPAAVFLVGGGSQTPKLHELVAQGLGMEPSRVAVGGQVHMKKMVESTEDVYGPEFATPLGIALTAAQQRGADAFVVTVNGKKLHLLQLWDTTVLGVLQSAGYHYSQIIGRTGKSVVYTLNGERKTAHGGLSSPSEVLRNDQSAALSDTVAAGDALEFRPAEQGEDARVTLGQAVGEGAAFPILLEGAPFAAGLYATVNGRAAALDTEIRNGDRVEARRIETLRDLAAFLDLSPEQYELRVGGKAQDPAYALHPRDDVRVLPVPGRKPQEDAAPAGPAAASPAALPAPPRAERAGRQSLLHVTLNGRALELEPQPDGTAYLFYDLLAFTDLDPRHPQGDLVQTHNGRPASYLAVLQDGDQAEIHWQPKPDQPPPTVRVDRGNGTGN